jgi:hypothetical protein
MPTINTHLLEDRCMQTYIHIQDGVRRTNSCSPSPERVDTAVECGRLRTDGCAHGLTLFAFASSTQHGRGLVLIEVSLRTIKEALGFFVNETTLKIVLFNKPFY